MTIANRCAIIIALFQKGGIKLKNNMISSMYKNYKELLQNNTTMHKAELDYTKKGYNSYPAFLWQEIVNNKSYIYISMLGFINTMNADGKVNELINSRIKEVYLEGSILPIMLSESVKNNDIDLGAIEKDAEEHQTQLELQRNFVNAYVKGVDYYLAVSDNEKQQLEVIKTFLNIDTTIENQRNRQKTELLKVRYDYSMDKKKIEAKKLSIKMHNKLRNTDRTIGYTEYL